MNNLNKRRLFIKTLLGGSFLFSWKYAPIGLAEKKVLLSREIPKSREILPSIGLGTYRTFSKGLDKNFKEPLKEVLRLFVECGGSVIDSSPMYGNSEKVVGTLSRELELRNALFMATKVWTQGKKNGQDQIKKSMNFMKTDSMDLLQIHNLVDWKVHAKTLESLKEKGLIRYSGITHYHEGAYSAVESILRKKQFDFLQINYSIFEREAEKTLLPLAMNTGHAVLINRPFVQGSAFRATRGKQLPNWAIEFGCSSWAQFFLKYVLSHPAVTCVIPATSKPKHLVDNMGAGLGELPNESTRRKMVKYIQNI